MKEEKAVLIFLKKNWKKILVILIIVGVGSSFIIHQLNSNKLANQNDSEVQTAIVEKRDLQKSVNVSGKLTATELARVTSTIGGQGITGIKVKKVNNKIGDYVEAGDIVVEFDGKDYDRQIAEQNATTNINSKTKDLEIITQQNNITTQQATIAQKTKDIADIQKWLDDKKIYYDNLIDARDKYQKATWDSDARARYNSESDICQRVHGVTIEIYESKQDEIVAAQNAIKAAQDSIAQSQLSIEVAQLNKSFDSNYTAVDRKNEIYQSQDATEVKAPISGYILSMDVAEGNNYTQGNSVFSVADTTGFTVEAMVDEYNISKISVGLPVSVKFEATDDDVFEGEITFVSVAAEGTTSATTVATTDDSAKYKIEITMKDIDERFRVGMTARVNILLASAKDTIAVPYDCLQENEDGSFFVTVIAEDGVTKDVKVEKGLESNYFVAISSDELKEGDVIQIVSDEEESTDMLDGVF